MRYKVIFDGNDGQYQDDLQFKTRSAAKKRAIYLTGKDARTWYVVEDSTPDNGRCRDCGAWGPRDDRGLGWNCGCAAE